MAIPNKATGYGNNSTARNVLGVQFTVNGLAAPPVYEAYDGGVFPVLGGLTTSLNTILVGTAGNGNESMLCLVDTSAGAPVSAWKTAGQAGASNPNRLRGQVSTVTAGIIPTVGERITYNMAVEIPSDVTTLSSMTHDLVLRYAYTGVAPSLIWAFNEGTEGVPVWTAYTPNTHGVRHTQSGSGTGQYNMPIPVVGTVDTAEGWITA